MLDAIPQLRAIHPVLFTHHWTAFGDLMRTTCGLGGGVERDLLLQLAWVTVFGLAALGRFTTTDVLA